MAAETIERPAEKPVAPPSMGQPVRPRGRMSAQQWEEAIAEVLKTPDSIDAVAARYAVRVDTLRERVEAKRLGRPVNKSPEPKAPTVADGLRAANEVRAEFGAPAPPQAPAAQAAPAPEAKTYTTDDLVNMTAGLVGGGIQAVCAMRKIQIPRVALPLTELQKEEIAALKPGVQGAEQIIRKILIDTPWAALGVLVFQIGSIVWVKTNQIKAINEQIAAQQARQQKKPEEPKPAAPAAPAPG